MWLASYGVFTGKSVKKVLTGIKLLPTPTECTQPDQFDLKGMHKIPGIYLAFCYFGCASSMKGYCCVCLKSKE